MNTKYGFEIAPATMDSYRRRLINQLWKLIPMRENQENWVSHLQVVIEELSGLHQVLGGNNIDFITLLSKLEGLTSPVCDEFMIYRKTVFRCIELLIGVLKDE